jgi:hypothetical protein
LLKAVKDYGVQEVIERASRVITDYSLIEDSTLLSIAVAALRPKLAIERECGFVSFASLVAVAVQWRGLVSLDLSQTSETGEILEQFGKSPSAATLQELDLSECSTITDQCIYHLLPFTQLRKLKIHNCVGVTSEATWILSQVCTTLTDLTITQQGRYYDDRLLNHLLPYNLPSLTALRFTISETDEEIAITRFLEQRENIEKFRIFEEVHSEELAAKLYSKCPKLSYGNSQHLKYMLDRDVIDNPITGDKSNEHLNSIEELNLDFTFHKPNALKLVENCPNLRILYLNVRDCDNVTVESFMSTIRKKQKIEELSFSYGSNIFLFPLDSNFSQYEKEWDASREGGGDWCDQFLQLRKLKLTYFISLSSRIFKELLHFPNLEELVFEYCNFEGPVPAAWIHELLKTNKYLKVLSFRFCIIAVDGEVHLEHDGLREFELTGRSHKCVITKLKCEHLHEIDVYFANCAEVEESILHSIARTPFIRDVGIDPLSVAGRQWLLERLHFMEELRLRFDITNTPSMESSFFRSLPLRLTRINLKAQIGNDHLSVMCSHLQRLKSFRLEESTLVTSLEDMKSTSLQQLTLFDVRGLTGTLGLSGLPNIRKVHIRRGGGALSGIMMHNKPFLHVLSVRTEKDLTFVELVNNPRLNFLRLKYLARLSQVRLTDPASVFCRIVHAPLFDKIEQVERSNAEMFDA